MKTKETLHFKLNDKIIYQHPTDITLLEVDSIKFDISIAYGCKSSDIELVIVHEPIELSDFDVNMTYGIRESDCEFPIYFTGVGLSIGSDEYLDAIVDNSLEDYLVFI